MVLHATSVAPALLARINTVNLVYKPSYSRAVTLGLNQKLLFSSTKNEAQ